MSDSKQLLRSSSRETEGFDSTNHSPLDQSLPNRSYLSVHEPINTSSFTPRGGLLSS